jgi:hypothetical protein
MTDIDILRERLAEHPLDAATHVELAHALLAWFETLTDDEFAQVYIGEPFDLLRTATGLAEGGERARICADLGLRLLAVFETDPQAVQDRDEAIHYLTEAVATGDPHVEMALADALVGRAGEADLTNAITHATHVLDLVEDTSIPLRHLSFAYAMRYETGKDLDDLRHSQAYFRRLVDEVDDPEVKAFAAHVDALLVLREIEDGGPAATLDQTIANLAAAVHIDAFWERKRQLNLLVLRAARFAWFGGPQEDYDAAVAGLADFAKNPDADEGQINACRLFLGMLAMIGDLPEELRRDPAKLTLRQVGDLKAGISPESLRLAREQMAAVRAETLAGTPMGPMVTILRATLLGGSPSTSEAEIDAAMGDLADVDEDDVGRALALGLLNGRKSQLGGGQRSADAMFKEFTNAFVALDENHPLRQPIADALGTLAKGWQVGVGTPEQNATTAQLLADAMAVLPPDHPARTDAAAKVALSSMVDFMADRSAKSLEGIAAALDEAIGRASSDPGVDSANLMAQSMVTGLRAATGRDLGLIDDSIAHLDRAAEAAPAGHAIVEVFSPLRAVLLFFRYMITGSLEDLDAADHYAASGDGPGLPLAGHMREATRIVSSIARSRHDLDEKTLAAGRVELAGLHSRMEPGDHLTSTVGALIDQLDVLQQAVHMYDWGPGERVDAEELDRAVSAVLAAHENAPDLILHVHDVTIAAMSVAGQGLLLRDVKKFDQAMILLGKVSARTDLVAEEQLSVTHTIGLILRMRYDVSRDHRDVNNAIDRLEHARRLVVDSPGSMDTAALLYTLADCYHNRADARRGDPARSVHIGLDAVRERAADVLLQTSDLRALDMAKAAKDEAADVARWCVAADRGDAAVQALELGRAMVLHATTFETTLGTLLREGGHHDIAALYERESAAAEAAPWNAATSDAAPAPQLRTDVRRRVLKAVADTDIADRLLAPPAIEDIAAALRKTGTAALVYLLPRAERTLGLGVIVGSDGSINVLTLSKLVAGKEIERFLKAGGREWAFALNDLCDWAWTAAMEEILDALTGAPAGPRRRLVLVPVGELAHVPWHAARRDIPGRAMRYACHDAVISYASSARQFLEATRRPRRDWPEDAVLVGVPGNKLYWAQKEIKEVHRRCYPDGLLLGTSVAGRNRVTPAKVRDVLPGGPKAASLLHLGLHGRMTSRPMESYLALSANEDESARLGVHEMLAAARQRKADAPGGLVVLAACTSDRTEQMPDEVLTLASTFLTAGAAGAVGARWEVGDLATMFFMIMFHHYLTAGYPDPATALRAAQVWMLDPRRVLPLDVDPVLGEEFASIDPAQVANWAAFTYQGH